MTTLSSLEKVNRVSFPVAATIGTTQEMITEHFSEVEPSASLELDFSRSQFIEIATLVFVIALVTDRVKQGLETKFRLPQLKRARDFLRVWRFPRALRKATGCPLATFVCDEDHHYFGENAPGEHFSYSETTQRIHDGAIETLFTDRFFSFHSVLVDNVRSGARAVLDESKRWEDRLVRSVLAKYLRGPEAYVPSRIVFESMTNAIRHPKARIIQTVSMFDAPGTKKKNSAGYFTIVYWDDGDSMIDTLKRAIHADKKIRAREFPGLYDNCRLIYNDLPTGKTYDRVIASSFLPDKTTPDELLLLATTFPGITSDVEGKSHEYHPKTAKAKPEYSLPGMGLHVLVNTIIDVFGGSMSFRTGRLFMNIKAAEAEDTSVRYRAKCEGALITTPKFRGNMLTIRLPLRTG